MRWMSYRRDPAAGLTRVRVTRARRRILAVLAATPPGQRVAGPDLAAAARTGPGTLYPFLRHLADAGWATGRMPGGGQPRSGWRVPAMGRVRDMAAASWTLTAAGRAGTAELGKPRTRRRFHVERHRRRP